MKQQPYLTLESFLDESVRRERKFDLLAVAGTEGICKDFSYSIKVGSPERLTEDEITQLMGKQLSVKIGYRDQKGQIQFRYINGLVYQLTESGMSRAPLLPDIWRYEIELGSWFRQLDFIRDCRIIQKAGNTCLKIVTDLLHEFELRDFRFNGIRNLPRREYAVIYNESIFNFIKRLAQEYGLIWRFEHFKNKHVLVFHPNADRLPNLPESASDVSVHRTKQRDSMTAFSKVERHLPVKDALFASYHWQDPPVKTVRGKANPANGTLNHFQYAAEFKKRSEGDEKIKRHNLALKTESEEYVGESTFRSFIAGSVFTLSAPALPDLTGSPYLIRDLSIHATATAYRNTFVAVSAKKPFVPKENEKVHRPRIAGLQTAMVVGEKGNDKVQTTSLGEVKVRFHWDHHSPNNSTHTSAYLRVAMPAAGNQKGMQFVPRIGEEVVVDFEDGNPEKPFIVGSVYSKQNPPPFPPNSDPCKSIIRNGPQKDANQVVFDDKPNDEHLDIVAKKDMTIDVTNDFNLDAVNNINITAKSIFIVDKGQAGIDAGGEIDKLSLATIIDLALESDTGTAGNNMMNLALGAVNSKAGGAIANDAGAMLANTSVLGINQSSEDLVSSVSQALMLNTAPTIINNAGKSITTKSGLAIVNIASENTFNDAKEKKDKIGLISTTETNGTIIKGKTSIGP